MKRKILSVLLSIGVVGGFTAGFASMGRHHRAHHTRFERKVTTICAEAVRQAQTPATQSPAAPAAP
jgi:hypothetical protein